MFSSVRRNAPTPATEPMLQNPNAMRMEHMVWCAWRLVRPACACGMRTFHIAEQSLVYQQQDFFGSVCMCVYLRCILLIAMIFNSQRQHYMQTPPTSTSIFAGTCHRYIHTSDYLYAHSSNINYRLCVYTHTCRNKNKTHSRANPDLSLSPGPHTIFGGHCHHRICSAHAQSHSRTRIFVYLHDGVGN